MYEDYKVYGPYTRKDKRQHVVLVHKISKKKKTVSYPKFLVENNMGRYLEADETVDHDDSDFSNNDLSNLIILTRKRNSQKDAPRIKDVYVDCAWCGVNFKLSKTQRAKNMETRAGPFCEKVCSGKYGASVQNGGEVLDRRSFEREYYKESGADLSKKQKTHFA